LVGSTPSIDNYYFTKKIIKTALENGYEAGVREIKNNPGNLVLREGVSTDSDLNYCSKRRTDRLLMFLE